MGWLRQLMAEADPPVKSFGALARSALASPSWPRDTRIQPRSFSALLSKLDRGIELEWLTERPQVRNALSEALGCAPAELAPAVASPASSEDAPARRFKLADVPFARSLDLIDEPLCPGIPAEVLRPATWTRLWWQAPAGSGKSLAGSWLEARALAAFVRAPTLTEALLRAPPSGPLFIELEREDLPASRRTAELDQRRVCVAAPFAPPDPRGWHPIASPPVDLYLDALVDWIASRLPPDGNFEPVHALEWLRSVPLAAGAIDGLMTSLGWCGLIDTLGIHAVRGKSLQALARLFFRQRLDELHDADGAWLKRAGLQVVVEMARCLLTDSKRAWDAPRSFDRWLELVPDQLQRGADLDWMRLSLQKAGSTVRPSDIDRAARAIPPGAFRIVQTLRAAGLLRAADADETLKLAPRWFGLIVIREAEQALLDSSPFEWGEALLREAVRARIFDALEARLAAGSAPLEDVLEIEADESPAHVAALEAVFRAAGLSLLTGVEIGHEQVEALWDEQMRLSITLGDRIPEPRIAPEGSSGRPPFHPGCFCLSALALSEQFATRRRATVLCPWTASTPPRELRRVYDRIFDAVQSTPNAPWALPSFALVDRLRAAIGSVAQDGGPVHALEVPGVVLDEVAHGVLSWDTADRIGHAAPLGPALKWLAARRGTEWPAVAGSVWEAWNDAKRPALHGSVLATDAPDRALFWPHAPPRLVVALASINAVAWCLPYALLSMEQWDALIDHWAALAPSARGSNALWRATPDAVARRALGSGALPSTRDALGELWQRHPGALIAETSRSASSGDAERALCLAAGAPDKATRELVAGLGPAAQWLKRTEQELDTLRAWLHARVQRQTPGWRAAYGLLDAIERALAPARRSQ